ncbi:MAG: Tim44/TimA family putative adaptor protein, partial [Hyphomicrobium sp.]
AREAKVRTQGGTLPTSGVGSSDKVISIPRREPEAQVLETSSAPSSAEVEEKLRSFARGDETIFRGFEDIRKTDVTFDPESFISGAKQAYEIIVTAFAEGNRKTLKDLLSEDVFDAFSQSIVDREKRGELVEQKFVGINKADILEAELSEGVASVTVRFVSQLITATRNKAGELIEGDPKKISDVTDVWTFHRDISSERARSNPNWRLISTQEAH